MDGERGDVFSQESYGRQLKVLCKDAGVTEVTPHELRHSCTELYVEQGASNEDVRRLLNHSSLTVTAHYMHRTDDRLTALAQRVGQPPIPGFGIPTLRVVSGY